MADLAQKRPFFHSERDLQHALAWSIQQQHPDAQVRLEPRPRPRVHLDVLVRLVGRTVAIEVKYLVAAFAGMIDDERFDLPNQAAHDIGRHDVVKDIVRLEQLVTDGYAGDGVALILASDPAYWRPGTKAAPIDAAFRIHEGQQLAGVLGWSAAAGPGTTSRRDRPLTLAGRYTCFWRPYATVVGDGGRRSPLLYLAFEVSDHRSPVAQPSPTTGAPEPLRPAALDRVASPNPGANAREEILVAVRDVLGRSGGMVFEIGDVVAEMRHRGTRYTDSTIRTHITSRMCSNAPAHHASTFDDFERLDRGRYRLRTQTPT